MSQLSDIRLSSKQTSFSEIPLIDIAPLIDGSDPQVVADKIGDVCENVGFFYVKNHGVERELVQRMYRMAQQFFDLPLEEKSALDVANSGETLRGYIPLYGENVDPGNTRDVKEAFDFGLHEEQVSPFFGPNQMPEGFPEFKQVCEEYHSAMLVLAEKLIAGIALSLGLPMDYFANKQSKPITIQRLLHYPPQEGQVYQEEIGIGAHTDYGFLTILSQDMVGGLQVRNRAGEWVSAPPVEDAFIVNIGDLVQTLTNDRYISTLHRVINTSGAQRYSIPFFIDMDFDAVIEVVPTCVSEDNPSKYSSYTCGQHKFKRFVESYAHLQNIETA
ncbi:isopenicillin N synthase family oxygenase [Vibrio sp. B1FLJ16]|uniref:isopenicillin N synthase family dioxygenase n=1 Tax=Vibrio sp. B1FLJ16 TaxID=2751178 RepID=UPI0015F3C07A|nr:isopenicillin N synthase family oxygenase [Vibrio sp. B1FLJ16]CAD7807117.1 Belongs to the iron ascorbate-dependent oxidoreductase family [Vibrio sp. B1FLJ16]CAE6904876.1 Belongs to the iron ascorbate-dependent oxidoreductase family [Vibrio sp. B1FLJ16]